MTHFRAWRIAVIHSVLALGLAMPGRGSAEDTTSAARQHFLAAQQDQQKGDLQAAAHEYEAFIHMQPGIPEAYLNLGLVYYAQARFDESAHALSTANRLRPGMRGVSLWLGIDEVKLHQPARGTALLREAVQQDPADKSAQSWLGTALWNEGQIDAALVQVTHDARLFPDDPDMIFARGEAYAKAASRQTEQLLEVTRGTAVSDLIYGVTYAGEHEWTKAEAHLQRAIERDPRLLDARLELGRVFIQQSNLDNAQTQLEQALQLDSHSASALALSGEVLILSGKKQDGLSRIGEAIAHDEDEALDALGLPAEDSIDASEVSPALAALCHQAIAGLETEGKADRDAAVALAALHQLSGDSDAAQQAYLRANTAQHAGAAAGATAHAMDAFYRHRYDEAEAALLRWVGAHPNDFVMRYHLIQARRHISNEQIKHLLVTAPDSYHIHQLLGQLYIGLTMANESTDGAKEDDKAIAEYRAVIAAKPDLAGPHFWLGHLYWKHGDAEHATEAFNRELELDPQNPEANAELGDILVAQGQERQAVPHLELALRVMPDLWPAYLDLGQAYAAEGNYPRAEELLRHSVLHDHDGSAHYQLGVVLREEGKTSQAAQAFAQVQAIKKEQMAAVSIHGGNGANDAVSP